MKRVEAILLLGVAVAAVWLPQHAVAADYLYNSLLDGGCLQMGDDAGNSVRQYITPGSQFMVSYSTYSGVRYRVCPAADAGSCTATSTDAPIEADKQVDLCAPSGSNTLSFYKLYDAGNPSICTYLVSPKTVCPP